MKNFQHRVFEWALSCLGKRVATDIDERAARVLEEACELAQAAGLSKEKSQDILDYVFSREPGEIKQEVGCVAVTLGVFCSAQDLCMEECAEAEYERISASPDQIRTKYYTKPLSIRGA